MTNRVGTIAAVVGLPVAVAAVIFLVLPQLDPTKEKSGDILEAQISQYDVPNGEYLGHTYSVRVRIKGFNDKTLPLGYRVRNYQGGAQVLVDTEASSFEPEGSDDTANSEVWVAIPNAPGTYYVEFMLYDNDGMTVLDMQKTATFQRSG